MCRENVEYRLPKVVQDFRAHIQKGGFDFRDDRVSSALDFLYVMYAENQPADTKGIKQGFMDLEEYMDGVSLDDNNAIFSLVCGLCCLYEERAFMDGLRLGAYLMLELQGK